jgi:glycosyltransferase involved in cell wall biosynthesis
MRLVYALPRWPTLYTTYIFRELQWMRSRGHHVAVISMTRGDADGSAILASYGLDDVPVLQLLSSTGGAQTAIDDAVTFARAQRPELVNAHMGREAADFARRLRACIGVPYVVRLYGGDVHSHPAPNLAEILDGATVVCSVSRFLAEVLTGRRARPFPPPGLPIRVDANKLRICHDGLAASMMAAAAAEQREGELIVGSVGRLAPIKRHCDIIDALAGLAHQHPGLRLRLIGGGELMTDLHERARALGMAHRVELTGPLPWSQVACELRKLHVYVQASLLEGFCTASVEAAAQGLPLLLSRTGIHEECVVPDVNGHLFEPGDVPALRERLASMLTIGCERRREMGAASLRIARERYVLDRLLPRVEAIFQAAVDRRPIPA